MTPRTFFDIEALAASYAARGAAEHACRAAGPMPSAMTAAGVEFRYMPLRRGDQMNGRPTDWVYACGCRFVWVLLDDAAKLAEAERADRLRALGWEPTEGILWRCPDCVAAWKEIGDVQRA